MLRELPLQQLVQADLTPLQSSNLASRAQLDIFALLPQQHPQTAPRIAYVLLARLPNKPVQQDFHVIKRLKQPALPELTRMLETESAQHAIRVITVLGGPEQSAPLELTP